LSPLNYSPSEVETILCAGILDIETLAHNDVGCYLQGVFAVIVGYLLMTSQSFLRPKKER
jgi:hypothetical protein